MLFRLIHTVIILLVIKHLNCQRRIIDGKKLENLKSYLVYFIHSDHSPHSYNGWTCAGALVHALFIVTAAACLEDVENLYAMAGYAKLIPYEHLHTDQCTTHAKTGKNKVISTCIPKSYELDYANVEKWTSIDIGVAQVENRFKHSELYEKYCTHKPLRVPISFNPVYQSPGMDAIVMGWGHLDNWRTPGDENSYIQEYARFASVRIMNKKKCKEYYKDYPELQKTIDKYMICTMERGRVDDAGVVNRTLPELIEQCSEDNGGQNCRRNFEETTHWNISSVNGRRQGICQNDHGAPLITWIGGKEHLIGIGSVFRVNQHGKCAGPYLFTSTYCNGFFLNCVLEEHLYKDVNDRRRSSICNQPPKQRGFDMIYRHANSINHSFNQTHIKRKSRRGRTQTFKRVTKHSIRKTTSIHILKEEVRIRPQISIRHFNQNQTILTKNVHI